MTRMFPMMPITATKAIITTTAVIKGLGMSESLVNDDELSSCDNPILCDYGNLITVIKHEQKDIKSKKKNIYNYVIV